MPKIPDLATTRKLPVTVYLPTLFPDEPWGPHRLLSIDPMSGIVGVPARLADHTLIYYEGNRYNASNIVTWADRVEHAAGRLTWQGVGYPTIALAMVQTEWLTAVGTFDGREITLLDEVAANRVYTYLELHERGEHALDDECRTTRLLNAEGRMES